VLDREHLAGAGEAGLHFVGDEQNAVFAADLRHGGEPSRRRHDEAALALHRLHDQGGHRFSRHYALESIFKVRGGLAIRHAVNVARERLEAGLVRMCLAGQRERQQGAPVESVFETDHRRAPRVGARDLDGILHGFGAAVQQQGLLGRAAGRLGVQLFGEPHVAFVGRHHKAGMQETVRLRVQRGDHARLAMAGIEAADTAGEIQVSIAVHVFDNGAFGAAHEDRGDLRYAARHGRATAIGQRSGAGSGNGSLQMNRGHSVTR
jgi:hypothetical protein